MADLWTDVRADVLRRLQEHVPEMPFEMKVRIAEDAARDVEDWGTPSRMARGRSQERPAPDLTVGADDHPAHDCAETDCDGNCPGCKFAVPNRTIRAPWDSETGCFGHCGADRWAEYYQKQIDEARDERDALRSAIQEALEHDKEWDLPPTAVEILSRAIDTKEQSNDQ